MARVNVLIVIAGIIGLGTAGYALVSVGVRAWRRRAYLELAVAVVVTLGAVLLLVTFGDRFIR
jgi:hypothetical protein